VGSWFGTQMKGSLMWNAPHIIWHIYRSKVTCFCSVMLAVKSGLISLSVRIGPDVFTTERDNDDRDTMHTREKWVKQLSSTCVDNSNG
jgi:hypothetical protein